MIEDDLGIEEENIGELSVEEILKESEKRDVSLDDLLKDVEDGQTATSKTPFSTVGSSSSKRPMRPSVPPPVPSVKSNKKTLAPPPVPVVASKIEPARMSSIPPPAPEMRGRIGPARKSSVPPPVPRTSPRAEPSKGTVFSAPVLGVQQTVYYEPAESFETTVSDVPPPVVSLLRRKYLIPAVATAAGVLLTAVVAIIVAKTNTSKGSEDDAQKKTALLEAQIQETREFAVEPKRQSENQNDLKNKGTEASDEQPKQIENEQSDSIGMKVVDEPGQGEADSEPEEERSSSPRRYSRKSRRHSDRKGNSSPGSKSDRASSYNKNSNNNDIVLGSEGSNRFSGPTFSGGSTDKGSSLGPNRASIKSAMKGVAVRARACSKFDTGKVILKLTISSGGNVMSSRAVGRLANTPLGKCVEKMARGAKFKEFKGSFYTFTHQISVD